MKKKRKLGRRVLGFLLALAMVIGMMPGMYTTVQARELEGSIYDTRDLQEGDIIGPFVQNIDMYDVTITFKAGGYYCYKSEVIGESDVSTSDWEYSSEYKCFYDNNSDDYERYYPYCNGHEVDKWRVVSVSTDTLTLTGYEEVQNNNPFTQAVTYRHYDTNGNLLENGSLASGAGIMVESDTVKWTDGNTYVVSGDVTIDKRVVVTGTVNLILLDGSNLTVNKGISVNGNEYDDEGETLNIYAGSTSDTISGTGELVADARGSGRLEHAGIGGDEQTNGGYLNIHGGVIKAYGNVCGAGIGGGNNHSHKKITIYGGTITATGGNEESYGSAGIGGGFRASGGELYIYGGNVTAIGTALSAGIGGGGSSGDGGSGGNVYIYGGNVVATGGNERANGIGGASRYGGGDQDGAPGNLTLGCVKLETSTDNVNWTETTDTGDRTRYMKITPASHNLTENVAVAATCTTSGNRAYWKCSRCGKYFSDEEGLNEIDENSWVIPATGHNLSYSADNNTITATCSNSGCDLAEGISLSVIAPEEPIFDGSGKAAVIPAYDTTAFSYVSPITYEKDGVVYNGIPTEVGTYTASVTAGESITNCATATVSFNITKATPTITTNPFASAITYGQKLKDSTLTGGAGSVDGNFGWKTPETAPAVSDSDNTAYEVVFTPADTSNYNTVNLNVTVHVNKADNPASVASSAAVTMGGNTINLADCVTMNGATGAISYEISGESNGCTLSDSVLTSGDTVGIVTVNVAVSEDDNHNALATQVINVTISDKGTQSISAENVTATYGDTDKSVNATVTTPETEGGAITYAVKPGSEEYIDVDASTGALTIKKTGTAVVVVTAEETATYAQATKEVTVTINKAESPSENPAPTPKEDLTDNGQPQELINPVTVTGGTIEYVIGTDGSTPPTSGWGPNIPTAAAPGTYYVWYKIVGDDNHQDSVPKCVIVTIAEKPTPSDSGEGGSDIPASDPVTPSGDEGTNGSQGADGATGYVKDVTGTDEAAGNYSLSQKIVNNGDLKTLLSLSDSEVNEGTKVWLDVTDLGNNAPDSDKALVESAKGDYTIGTYLDINLFKKVGNNEAVKVTKTNGNVEVSLVMPENLRKEGRIYGIVRVHDGMAALIPGSYAGDSHALTFKTDGFSTYAIVYKDGATTGGNTSSNTSTSTDNSSSGSNNTTTTTTSTVVPKTDGMSGIMVWSLMLILSLSTLGVVAFMRVKEDR